MHDPMEDVQIERLAAGTAVVEFTGEHDLLARDALGALLDSLIDENDLVVADFSRAAFVDSSTMHVLLNADMAARRRGSIFRLQLGTTAIVRAAFELSGILQRLDCFYSREEALSNGAEREPHAVSVADD